MYISNDAIAALLKQMEEHSKAASEAEKTGDREASLYQRGCAEGMNRVLCFIGEPVKETFMRPSVEALSNEDAADLEIARLRLAEIDANPEKLLRGRALEAQLKKFCGGDKAEALVSNQLAGAATREDDKRAFFLLHRSHRSNHGPLFSGRAPWGGIRPCRGSRWVALRRPTIPFLRPRPARPIRGCHDLHLCESSGPHGPVLSCLLDLGELGARIAAPLLVSLIWALPRFTQAPSPTVA